MAVGGLDIGTSGVKFVVFSNDGTMLCRTYREYSYVTQQDGYCLDAREVYRNVKEVLAEAAGIVNSNNDNIEGIAVSVIGESCVLLDENDQVLGNSILYNDKRGLEESSVIKAKFGEKEIFSVTGVRPNGTYSLEKLMWIKEHEPYWKKIRRICLFEDYIIYMLTGEQQIAYSIASRTMAFDIEKKCWNKEILDFAEIPVEWLSKPAKSGSFCGTVKRKLAEELGFHNVVSVFNGGHDSWCCAVGAGMSVDGICMNVAGSGDTMNFRLRSAVRSPAMFNGGFCCAPTAYEDIFGSYAFCPMSGNLIRWFRDQMCPNVAKKDFFGIMDANMPTGPSGIIINPNFSSSGTPNFSLRADGEIDGLNLNTSPFQLYKGLMESTAYQLRYNKDYLKNNNLAEIKSLRAVGGGTSSKKWMQIKSDILKVEIETVETFEAGATGCAMISAVSLGICCDYNEAENIFIKLGKIYRPILKNANLYDEQYSRFVDLMKN